MNLGKKECTHELGGTGGMIILILCTSIAFTISHTDGCCHGNITAK